ncbi:MAG TPA: DUF1820 family protein [Burkholderiaceae bacterium]|nr:DUF1820 family protein [Burkholderiaceae bacterium]
MTKKHLYKVQFINQGKLYEVYARRVGPSDLFGFIEVADLVFGEKSSVVIDPSEERLKAEFDGVPSTHIPMHAIVRIDEVEKRGTAKIVPLDGKAENVVAYPFPSGVPKKSN